MIDLPDNDVLLQRGIYSTINAALKDEQKKLQSFCESMMHANQQILKRSQDSDAEEALPGLIGNAKMHLSMIEKTVDAICDLSKQKNEVKLLAWP